ncbi:MAG: translation initiation factor IF-2 [bacterium]|nr:translation initiation factor IF-2 [bacterium]
MNKNQNDNQIERPPVVVIMGHIDHGKSTLLDYIRKTNVVDGEAGGITQHISAYEVLHKGLPAQAGENNKDKKITFLDTPGHEAFSKMRERGAKVADIAILIVSATEGVKQQTIEAYKTIEESKIPFIVAINKIDKPEADIEKTKMALAENEMYLENYGGKIPFALISAKSGQGVDELLSLILILSELENFTGNNEELASGYIIEANLNPKKGISSSLIIKNGYIKSGMFVASEESLCATRMMENFQGKMITEASMSSPIRLIGFDKIPKIGSEFKTFKSKDEALEYIKNNQNNTNTKTTTTNTEDKDKKIIPIILKADVSGSLEAITKEIENIKSDTAVFKVIGSGEGPVSESDIKNIGTSTNAIVIAFNVKADANARDLAERLGVAISYFDIIYKITEWLIQEMETRKPKIETLETTGKLKIIKAFSRTKEKQIVGGKVLEGFLLLDNNIKIMRRDFEIGRGKIVNLEKGKMKTSKVEEGDECGMMIESKIEIVAGDTLESFNMVQR